MRYKFNQSISLKWMLVSAVILTLAAGLTLKITPVRADVAPPKAPPGSNPDIGTMETNVRMMDEKVVIEIQEEDDITQMGSARVWAEYHMKNLGNATEVLMVRFPSSFNDGFSGYPEIEDMMVYIDNISVPTSRIDLAGEPDNWEDPVQWVEFEVVFPPGKIVEIEVDYTLYGTGEYPFVSYGYLLETGAGWNGTIGSAEIIVRLPFTAIPGTVFIDSSPGWGGTTPGAHLSGNEVTWYFEDFEPAYEHNISIAMVWPSAWHKVMEEENQVWDFPNDGDAWGRLAKLYKEMSRLRHGTREDAGGSWLFDQSAEAYKQALTLHPDDALWHAGYADLLVWNSIWEYRDSAEARGEFIEALRHMQIAYMLDPDQPYIQDYLQRSTFPKEAVDKEGGEYEFYWLTQTPTLQIGQTVATQQQVSTQAVLYTATPEPTDLPPTQPPPTQTAAADQEPTEEGGGFSLPFCGSIIMFPFALVMILVVPKIQSKKNRDL